MTDANADDGALSLVVFDVDGTLVDSLDQIAAAMGAAFCAVARPAPPKSVVARFVGLDLSQAVAGASAAHGGAELRGAVLATAVEAYRTAFKAARATQGAAAAGPLYPRARETLNVLRARPETLLGVATGKARPGLEHLLDVHDLRGVFATTQTRSEGPGKPHPGMLEACLRETGVAATRAAMVGDTTFDVEMALNAGFTPIGVAWGYHAAAELTNAGAAAVIEKFDALIPTLRRLELL